MTLTLRYMRLSDIPEVTEIDRLSFDLPWSARSYRYEVSESSYSHMVTLEYTAEKPQNGIQRLIRQLSGDTTSEPQVVGYGGLWHIAGEGHISTIAVHPTWRGRGWGEVLLAGMVRRAITLRSEYIVLEVRVSNEVAQRLYRKYEFQTFGVKEKYYSNDGEDAYDMRLYLEDAEVRKRSEERFLALRRKTPFLDRFTVSVPPHPAKR